MRNSVGADLDSALGHLNAAATRSVPLPDHARAPVAEAHALLAADLRRLLQQARGQAPDRMQLPLGNDPVERLDAVAEHNAGVAAHRALQALPTAALPRQPLSGLVDDWSQRLGPRPDGPGRPSAPTAAHDLTAAARAVALAAESTVGTWQHDGAGANSSRTAAATAAGRRDLTVAVATTMQAYARAHLVLVDADNLPRGRSSVNAGADLAVTATSLHAAALHGERDSAWRDVFTPSTLTPAAVERPGQVPAALQRLTGLLDRTTPSTETVRLVATALATTSAAARAALPGGDRAHDLGARLHDCTQALGAARDATLHYRSASGVHPAARAQAGELQRGAELLGRWPQDVPPALTHAVVRQLPAATLALRDACTRLVFSRDLVVSDRMAGLGKLEVRGDLRHSAWFPVTRTGQSQALTRELSSAYLHAHLARRRLDVVGLATARPVPVGVVQLTSAARPAASPRR